MLTKMLGAAGNPLNIAGVGEMSDGEAGDELDDFHGPWAGCGSRPSEA
jgi:hypothetical protein